MRSLTPRKSTPDATRAPGPAVAVPPVAASGGRRVTAGNGHRGGAPVAAPRERLLAAGAATLSDLELVTVLLERGGAQRAALTARQLLHADGLGDLASMSGRSLLAERRVGAIQAATLAACFELGRRVFGPAPGPPSLTQASQVHAVTRDLELARREHFVVLHMDARNRVLTRETVSVGSLNASIVHPREVFSGAIRSAAASVILVHNHPSGDPEPSADDLGLTRRLAKAGALLGIEVLDHLIIGRGCFVSLKSRGVL